jgi:NlpC/P60 family
LILLVSPQGNDLYQMSLFPIWLKISGLIAQRTAHLQPRRSPKHLTKGSPQPRFWIPALSFLFIFSSPQRDLYGRTVLSLRHGQFAVPAICETYKMTGRFIFIALCLTTASAVLGQNIRPASAEKPGSPVGRTEGRKILATIPTVDVESESETDCSHLVHDVYERAGFPYDYVSSRELYAGSANFTRVHNPQPGDLVAWRGHVGIVIDPKEHSFFSFVRSGPDTQFYDSAYWRSRGSARFYRYVTDKELQNRRTGEAADRADSRTLRYESAGAESRSPLRSASISASDRATAVDLSRAIDFQVAGKSPSPEEIVAGFVKMNQDFGESFRSLNGLGKTLVVYRAALVSGMQIKGKHGTALIQIESLGAPTGKQTDSQLLWKEQPLEFEKTRKGWVMTRLLDVAYVKREVALQDFSERLSELARNADPTAQQKAEQKEIIRLLNWLVIDDSRRAPAQNN